jgi:glycosyltransferase involved in cell wall biosynthesis
MRPEIVCVTPVKNEAWILESFLRAASLWADRIIVLDQQSTDGTAEIAERFEKAHVVRDEPADFDETARSTALFQEARRLASGPQVLIALDADEALSSDLLSGAAWRSILSAPAGTVIRFPLANLAPGGARAWIPPGLFPFGYVDDGAEHSGSRIHTPRVPMPEGAPMLDLPDGVMLHRQYLDWRRMKTKQCWYQCWELVNDPDRSPLEIFRQYHHMDAVPDEQFVELPDVWLTAYRDAGIDLTVVDSPERTHWDEAVLGLLREHGAEKFRRLNVWGVDWQARARALGQDGDGHFARDPRRLSDRAVHRWLQRTQGLPESDRRRAWGELVLRRAGW